MRIRSMRPADAGHVASTAFRAFRQDELYLWLYPEIEKYPEEMRRGMLLRTKMRLCDPHSYGIVAIADETDGLVLNGKIIGYAFWNRQGNDPKARAWYRDSLASRLNKHLLRWEMWYQDNFMDSATAWDRVMKFRGLMDCWSYTEKLDSDLHLDTIGVLPEAQGKGIGRQLIEWGQQRAAEDSIPITLEASVVGQKVYTKLGFQVIEQAKLADELQVINAMLWEPDHMKGH